MKMSAFLEDHFLRLHLPFLRILKIHSTLNISKTDILKSPLSTYVKEYGFVHISISFTFQLRMAQTIDISK